MKKAGLIGQVGLSDLIGIMLFPHRCSIFTEYWQTEEERLQLIMVRYYSIHEKDPLFPYPSKIADITWSMVLGLRLETYAFLIIIFVIIHRGS